MAVAGNNNTVTIPGGLPEEQFHTILGRLDKLGISPDVVNRFFDLLREKRVPPEDMPAKLEEIARRHMELLERVGALHPEVPENARRLADARAAIARADYDRAASLLTDVEQAEDDAADHVARLAKEAIESVNRHRRAQAEARVERGRLSAIRFDYRTAAEHFHTGATLLPPEDEEQRRGYLTDSADALRRHGDEKGDNAALFAAIARYREILPSRNRYPALWARIQNNLGNALRVLGGRESGTARLEAAVDAYGQALLERTRDRVPLDWATTQNNLGTALWTLGEREGGTERLEAAVDAYGQALLERTRARVPFDWAKTQNNLGLALAALAERKKDAGAARKAVAAFEGSLEVSIEADASYYIDRTTANLAQARALLSRLEMSAAAVP